ncbi:alpha-N-acetylneuraminide alpha-2,8-sialyltransferase-like [Diadema setosum]|uniref:alpha-N-acetylneuraminide alpha-2,8-sialyltransferase-like n=1 Tax=Diadema setosum TaxID=31175 RepID=UPI003B3BCC1F
MITRRWMRILFVLILLLALAKVCLRMIQQEPRRSVDSDFEFAALIRERSGGRKRIPPDSNYTDTVDAGDRLDKDLSVSGNQNISGGSETWRGRKFVGPGAMGPKVAEPEVLDPEVEARLWMEVTNHSAPQIEEMRALAKKPWKANISGLTKFREMLQDNKVSTEDVLLTQNNTRVGKQLRFALNRDAFANITNEIYTDFLPKKSSLSKMELPRCAVIGASGILLNSLCGSEIDHADFVFRCNMPTLTNFERDVGGSSNMTTMNTMTIVSHRYHFLQSLSDSKKLIRALQAYRGLLWMPVFGLKSSLSFNLRVVRLLSAATELPDLEVAISNPDHFAAVQDFWRGRFVSGRISTGLYLTTLALTMCRETHLYGFWPFSRDLSLRPIKHHYYDAYEAPLPMHSFTDEFGSLLKMHEDGILRMHFGQCNKS